MDQVWLTGVNMTWKDRQYQKGWVDLKNTLVLGQIGPTRVQMSW